MRTITFYSYKGGVGRSLALTNIAMRLSQLNKKVCIIDFDLDAPGLRFKFLKDYALSQPINKGIVDYIHEFSSKGNLPKQIRDYTIDLIPNDVESEKIQFISAGDIHSPEYWKKLSMINWASMFYSKEGQGVKFFLDLKAKIETELNPDYLLIDSRTGITDISGITLRILADEIVVLAINNKENLWGTKKIIQSINLQHNVFNKDTKVRFILTRLPYTESPQDKEKEFLVIQNVRKEFENELQLTNFDMSVIHTDRELEENESLIFIRNNFSKDIHTTQQDDKRSTLWKDYLTLFEKLTEGDSFPGNKYSNIKEAQLEYVQALNQKSFGRKLNHLNNAIKLNNRSYQYYLERAKLFWDIGEFEKSTEDFQQVLKLKPNDLFGTYGLGLLYFNQQNYISAIELLEKVVDKVPDAAHYLMQALVKLGDTDQALTFINSYLVQNPDEASALNARANLSRLLANYEGGLADIYKAIEINPNEPLYLGTLAEIRAEINDIEGFYLSLTMALSKGLSAVNMNSAKEVYEKFKSDKRFIELMNKYQIDIEVLFAED